MSQYLGVLRRAYVRTSWTDDQVLPIKLKDLKSMASLTAHTKNISAEALAHFCAHFNVTTVAEVLQHHTSNDRTFLFSAITKKEAGETDRMHEIVEKAHAVNGVITQEAEKIVVDVAGKKTEYIEKVIPLPVASRPGLGHFVNVLACMSFVESGQIRSVTMTDTFKKTFDGTLLVIGQIEGFVNEMSKAWTESDHMTIDINAKKTIRGLECMSIYTRFLTGLPIPLYLSLQTRMVTQVFDLFETRRDYPTDSWKMADKQKNITVAEKTSVMSLATNAKGLWGEAATEIKKEFGCLPKILVGPIHCQLPWFSGSVLSEEVARAAVVNSTSVRGGDSSYWSRMINCMGFSVATESLNRKRMLIAMAAGVLKTDSTVQIRIAADDIRVVDHSLELLGYSKAMINYLVTKEVKVTMAKSDISDRMYTVAKNEHVFVAIDDTKLPTIGKNASVKLELALTSKTMFETIEHEEFVIFMPVFTPDVFGVLIKDGDGDPELVDVHDVVTIRPPFDLRAMVCTDAAFVCGDFFPKRKKIKKYTEFVTDVLAATKGSMTQIAEPAKIRTTSLLMLNCAQCPMKTMNVRVRSETGEWEYASIDDTRFADEGVLIEDEYDKKVDDDDKKVKLVNLTPEDSDALLMELAEDVH